MEIEVVLIQAVISMTTSFLFALSNPWWLLMSFSGIIGFQGARFLKRSSISLFLMAETAVLTILIIIAEDVLGEAYITAKQVLVLILFIGMRLYTISQTWALYNILRGLAPTQGFQVVLGN